MKFIDPLLEESTGRQDAEECLTFLRLVATTRTDNGALPWPGKHVLSLFHWVALCNRHVQNMKSFLELKDSFQRSNYVKLLVTLKIFSIL